MDVEKIRDGMWRWTAPHPDWKQSSDWPEDVGCLYYEGPDAVVLFDPLVPAGEEDRFWEALDRDVERANLPVVVLRTVRWHQRSVDEVVARYPGARRWRRNARLPSGIEPCPAEAAEETLFWIAEHKALVAGDVLLGTDDGGVRVCPDSWLPKKHRDGRFRESLRYLLDLPVELVLISHGRPVLANGRDALAAALA